MDSVVRDRIHFQLSGLKLLLLFVVLLSSAYFSFSILAMPYEQLEQNADKYHPIIAYLFFIPFSILITALILIYGKFICSRNKGLIIADGFLIDNSSPFSIGEIPAEQISSIYSSINGSVKYKFVSFKINELNVNLRKRKKDINWWKSKGFMGTIVKKLYTYTIPTRGFKASHSQILDSIKCFADQNNIKVTEVDHLARKSLRN
ncbi:hypothetical protein QWY77_13870 [Thalassotalea ponticola]|uniref:hypothetical protein n=1 Tax=Thalassotalea ponticola TaxID=1523392 RepID=UPI0025B53F81|nr:hypothetical protein [Thalassotalea ponticola]MDN3653829.1 hypothetical protein [Thalassotalea ponticola]